MRFALTLSLCLLLSPTAIAGGSPNPADFPLRIRIFNRTETNFYHRRVEEEAKGEGRANLFENSEAHGVDFSFECSEKVKDSFGFETYPARWKKPGQKLQVLLPKFGKTGEFFTCDFNTDVKTYVYTSHDGKLGQESVAEYKAWMVRHDYDPEHGKDMPTKTPAGSDPASTKAPTPPGAPATPRNLL